MPHSLLVGLLLLTAQGQAAGAPKWRRLSQGLEIATWKVARYDSSSGKGFCRMGSPNVILVRIDPELFGFGLYHYSMYGTASKPLSIEEWRKQIDASVVMNAGPYRPDLSHLRLLVNGRWKFTNRLLADSQGVFVAEPSQAGLPRAHIIDLKWSRFRPDSTSYTQLLEGAVLFDATGNKRVRRGSGVSNRTAIAEDFRGRILLVYTEGGYTVWEFAQMLQQSPFDLVQALALDSGHGAGLAVAAPGFRYVGSGQWESGEIGDIAIPGLRKGLPAVIGVFSRY